LCQWAEHLCQWAEHLCQWAEHLCQWHEELAHWHEELVHGKVELVHRKVKLVHGKVELLHGKVELLHGQVELLHGQVKLLHGSLRSSPGQFPELQRAEDLVPGSETAREGRLLAVPAQLPKHLADLPGCLGLSQGAGGERRDDDGACLERSPRAAGFSAGPVARGAAYFSASTALGTSLSRWLVFFVTPSRWDRVPASS